MTAIAMILGGVFFLYLLAFLYWRWGLKAKALSTPPVLLFHKVDPINEWGVTSLRPEKFAGLLGYLKEQGFQSLSIDQVSGFKPDEWGKKVLLTFDDAYAGIYTHALPVLESLGHTATIFVITGFVGKPNTWDMNWGGKKFRHLSWEQIRELAGRGFSFGSHTVNHPDLTKLSQRWLEYELKKSKQDLEDQLGREVVYLSYPFGRFNIEVQKEALRQGYQKAFSIYPGRSQSIDGQMAIKRMALYRIDSPLSLRIKLNEGFWFWLEDLKCYLINRLSLATTLIKPAPDYSLIKTH